MPLGLSDNLFKRVVSAVSLLPIVLGVIYLGGWWFYGFLVLGGVLMSLEWNKMTDNNSLLSHGILIAVTLFAPAIAISTEITWHGYAEEIISLIVVCFLAIGLIRPVEGAKSKATFIGAIYLFVALFSIALLRMQDAHGLLVFWVFISVWAMDVGGYFAGKSIGGPKLAPKVSPKKTWAGLIGGMLLAALVSAVISWAFAWNDIYLLSFAGFVLAFIAQIGDLYESAIKRRFGVKDSGALIPGHGGILDRVDGLVFAAPAAVIALNYLSVS
ncbi:phosphatidate cytidylyltransferase [Kordiimonas laminariae]|uniref:phosphatidate cytidylyltransferase n=1 Tax=Kordiimonas laminariae TaxID=2917717 RepID=UPI001FF53634|nr:phosphatidate cytidylyltransferase [Kordiimonas laminariae]MCK0071016.1 phosphatidate cytidylyltransferase [Kordiimonas laminariae]